MGTVILIVVAAIVLGGGYYFVTNKKVQSRTKARIRGFGDGLADEIGDIVDDRREGIIDRKETNAELERKLATVLAQIDETKDKAQDAIDKANEYSELVDEAIAADNDEAAESGIKLQEQYEETAQTLTSAVESLEAQFEELKAKLDESRDNVEDAERNTAVFEARHTALNLRKKMADAGAFDSGDLDFSEQDDELRRQERELDAKERLSKSSSETSIEDFKKAAKKSRLADKLAARKAKANASVSAS